MPADGGKRGRADSEEENRAPAKKRALVTSSSGAQVPTSVSFTAYKLMRGLERCLAVKKDKARAPEVKVPCRLFAISKVTAWSQHRICA